MWIWQIYKEINIFGFEVALSMRNVLKMEWWQQLLAADYVSLLTYKRDGINHGSWGEEKKNLITINEIHYNIESLHSEF